MARRAQLVTVEPQYTAVFLGRRLNAGEVLSHDDPADDSDPGTVTIVSRRVAPGHKLFVARRVQRFLLRGTRQHSDQGEWNFLSKWAETPNDTVLPLYNESGSEADYEGSLLDEVDDEEAERQAQHRNAQRLLPAEIASLVDDYIQQQEAVWTQTKLPQRRSRDWRLWNTTRGGRRSQAIASIKREIDRHTSRLDKLKTSITDEIWSKAEQVQQQCRSLEVTISERMDLRHELEVLSQSQPPPRPEHGLVTKTASAHRLEDDEESLNSDTDNGSDMANDFVEIDDELPEPRLPQSRRTRTVEESIARPVPTSIRALPPSPYEKSPASSSRNVRHRSRDSVLGSLHSSPDRPRTVIDLTHSSPHHESEESEDDPSDPKYWDDLSCKARDAHRDMVKSWKFESLRLNDDGMRIVMKLLQEMDPKTRKAVDTRFCTVPAVIMQNETRNALKALQKGNPRLKGFPEDDNRIILIATRLWAACSLQDNRIFNTGIPPAGYDKLSKLEKFGEFHRFVKKIAWYKLGGIDDSDDAMSDDADNVGRTGRKPGGTKREKKKAVRDLQDAGKERVAVEEQAKSRLRHHLDTTGLSQTDIVIINPSKSEEDSYILVNNHIASRIKPHQKDGIQFMWREIVTGVSDDGISQGCLLAHTMGLGKSMQAITLLVTIAEAAANPDPSVYRQIPEHLRMSRILLLCPPGLIENWLDEWANWQPRDTVNVGIVRDVASIPAGLRFKEIHTWYEQGGVLVLSYEMFRNYIQNKPKLSKKGTPAERPLNDEQYRSIEKWLLKGPSVVLADEAHKIKNRTSSIGALVQRFKTNSRIALTGTPLANNLSEYYAMIDWVAPGYLDDPEDFRAFYQQPIEQGTYADSTAYEQRRSLKKLRALMADIAPKVQRKDIKAISKDLQQKTEFVLKCPLTPLQSQAYTAFVETIGTADSKVATVQLFDWMSVLGLLCDHPSTFWHKLQSRNDTAKPARKASRLSPQGDVEQDPDISAMDLPDAVFTRESSIFSAPGINIEHHGTSSKTALARSIIVQATRLGDRVLVFTHYIPVLDYLENMLSRLPESLKVGRLDGKTPMSRRLEMAQAVNNGRLDVMLISTSAGGMGLNITGANRVILMDFGFNPMWEEQAIGRAYRIGQKKEVYVYHLLTAGTHEEKLHQITIYKQQLSQRAVDGKNPNRSAVKVKEMMGAPPTEIEQQDLTTVAGIDSVLDEVLKTKAGREVRSIQTVETLHRETDETLTVEEEHEVATFLKQRKAPKVRPQQAAEMLGGGGGL